ncbi:TldD/PmbA family protein [Candidatus Latescibacterota bacterium]
MKKALEGLNGDYAEIRIERSESTALSFMGPGLEDIGTTFKLGGCVRVCVNGGWGFASFNTIDDIGKSALSSREMAMLAAGEKTVLAPAECVIKSIKSDAVIDPSTISLEEKHELLKKYNDIMLADSEIVTTKTIYRDIKKDTWLHTSDGTMLHQESVRAGVSFQAMARDGANIQRGLKSFGDSRGYETVLNLESEVENAVKTARDLIKAPKVKGGIYPVILDPELSGVFAHEAFGHLSEADFIYENPQALEMMKMGRRFGLEFLNIIDDGTRPGENGYTPYDDEGIRGEKTYLIQNGVLTGRLHSRETAGKMGEKPTGNARAISTSFSPIVRMTSTYIDSGEYAFEEMLEGIKNGIYACGFLGGMTDLERFTFSSAYAYRIENGKITTPVRDVVLTGNVFETLNNISMIGNDLTLYGGLGGCGKSGQSPLPVSGGSPHIRIENVLIG